MCSRDTKWNPRTQNACIRSDTDHAIHWAASYVCPLHANILPTRRLILVYQPFMLLALKRWFPDFESHVLALGGTVKPYVVGECLSGFVVGDPAAIQPDARCLPKHPNIPRNGQVPHTFYLMRVLFEPLLRRLVKGRYPNIKCLRGTVTGITLDTDRRKVTGVEYTNENRERVHLGCALFVDCTGAARLGVKWLQKAGLQPPSVITYNPRLRYSYSECFRYAWQS